METKRVETWSAFVQAVDAFRDAYGVLKRDVDGEVVNLRRNTILFRGQAREGWALSTTLERRVTTTFTIRDYYDKVLHGKSEIETFTGHRWNVPQGPALDAELSGEANRIYMNLPGYEYLVYLRHHGYPSPLLDWTESPYIAAFFALADAACKSPAVYCYVERPHGVKGGMVGQPAIWLRGPHVTSHKRHFAQRAWYTIAARWDYTMQQHVLCPHESVFGREDERQDVAVKLVFSDAAVAEGRKRLADYNIKPLLKSEWVA